MSPRFLRASALSVAFGLLAGAAHAHSPIPGIEGFYTGLLHPATSPNQLLILAALGLLLGQARGRWTGSAWGGFACAMLAGIAAGQLGASTGRVELALVVLGAAAATLAALLPGRMGGAVLVLSVCGGFALGLASTPDSGPFRATAITFAGSFAGANLGLLYVAGTIGWVRDRAKARWTQVGLRVIASWIAAIAILMAALEYSDGRGIAGFNDFSARENPFHLVNRIDS